MSLIVGTLYHWSPVAARGGIVRRGLLPRTVSAIALRPWRAEEHHPGHYHEDEEPESILAVCLGTTPMTAWCLSGALGAGGELWDLWEVELDDDDEVHYRPEFGRALDEVRVANPIPRSRVWWAGTRLRGRNPVRSNPPR
jgi:hypothetical protein